MPRGDGTGPNGMGSMTGRAAGYCAGYAVPGFVNTGGVGLGRGRGRGRGRGFRNRFYATRAPNLGQTYTNANYGYNQNVNPTTAAQETRMLKDQAEILKQQLNEINNRIDELKNRSEQDKD